MTVWRALLIAITTTVVAAGLRLLLIPWLGDDSPFLLFVAAVSLSAWWGGMLPGLLATLLGIFGAVALHRGSSGIGAPHTVLFVAIGIGLSVLAENLRRGRRRARVGETEALDREHLATQEVGRRRVAETAAFESRRRFQLVADSAPVMIWLAGVDGRCTYFNKVWLDFTGRSLEQELGEGWISGIHVDDRDAFLQGYRAAFVARRPFSSELRVRRHDGIFRRLRHQCTPFLEDGAFAGTIASCIDITDDRNRESALRENEERLRFALEAAQLGDWDLDLETGTMSRSTRCERFLGHLEPASSYSFDAFLAQVLPDERDGVRRRFDAAVEVGTTWDSECRIRQPGGALRWIWMRGRIQRDPASGRALRMCGTIADITERKELQAERERLLVDERQARSEAEWANQLKDEFLATVSHELRTPLQAILGWSRILREGGDSADIMRGLETIERNATLQAQLIEDLLDMSRILSNKLRLDVQNDVDLGKVIQQAIESLRPTARAKGVEVRSVLSPAAMLVKGDSRRLQQVMWNLLSNAVKFTPPAGEVEVASEVRGSEVVVRVRDTGSGIAPEFLPDVFDRFRQQDASSIRKHGGLGIGLAIVRRVVEMHGGSIQASSPGLSRGATLTLTLPLQPEGAGAARPVTVAPRAAAAAPANLTGVRVLAVDDEPDALSLMREILTRHGAQVVTATGVSDAMGHFDREPVDIVVSDIAMPGLDGYDLVRRIRQHPRGDRAEVPAVALTAYAQTEDRVRALMAGFQVHLTKPVDPNELVEVVGMLLRDKPDRKAPETAPAAPERILILDDEVELRDLIARFLKRDGYTVRSAETIPEAVQIAAEFQPTLLVADWLLKEGVDGGDAVRAVRKVAPHVKAIVMSGLPPEQVRSRLGEVEVLEVLEKPFQVSALFEQIQRALA